MTVTDVAGNSATFTTAAFKIDKTAPTLTWGTPTAPNSAGWNNTNVTVPYTTADSLSGVSSSSPTSPLVITTEGSAVTGTVTVTDVAGNSATFTTAAFKIDKTAPTLTWGTPTAPNGAGWNNTNVTVPYTTADSLSGVSSSSPTSPLVITTEGSAVTGTVTVTDVAGNSATFTTAAFKIDKTAPTLTWGTPTAPNGAGWNNTNVTVPYTTADSLSGVSGSSPSSPLVITTEGSAVTGTVTVTDVAGNSATFTTAAFKIDKTAPTLTWGTATPAPNSAGWNDTNVTVPYTVADTLSGVSPNSPASPLVITTAGTGVTGTVTVTDVAGNSATFTSAAFNINMTPPTVTINMAAGQASPTSNASINFTAVFSEPVTDFASADVDLCDCTTGGTLACAVTNSNGDKMTYNVAICGMGGCGSVVAFIPAGMAHDVAGNANLASTSANNTVTYTPALPAQVVGQYIFYNNCKWDAHTGYTNGDPAPGPWDDAAIATDKSALLPGQTATYANYTDYVKGIDGIMIDISGLNGYTPTVNDFQFQVGNTSTPNTWGAAPTPAAITDRVGAGVNGSDRITITWADNAIQDEWLQVTALAANLGLSANYVFYFGNQIGSVGVNPSSTRVTAIDASAVQANYSGLSMVPITDPYDINRDKSVNAIDASTVQANYTGLGSSLILLSAPQQTMVSQGSQATVLLATYGVTTGSAASLAETSTATAPSSSTLSTAAVDAVHAGATPAAIPTFASNLNTAVLASTTSTAAGDSSASVVRAEAINDCLIGGKSRLPGALEEHLLANLLANARR